MGMEKTFYNLKQQIDTIERDYSEMKNLINQIRYNRFKDEEELEDKYNAICGDYGYSYDILDNITEIKQLLNTIKDQTLIDIDITNVYYNRRMM